MIKLFLNITNSKLVGYMILIMAFVLDIMNDRSGTVFMFAIPFVVFLITGKQYIDAKRENGKAVPPEQ